jgi:hypothetical protein
VGEICAAASEALKAAPGSILQGLAGVAIAATLIATPDVEIEWLLKSDE